LAVFYLAVFNVFAPNAPSALLAQAQTTTSSNAFDAHGRFRERKRASVS
jgi:hypothetical protein